MADPMLLGTDRARAAYSELGLDPDRFYDTKSILIEPALVTVVRIRVDERGRARSSDGQILTETVQIAVSA